MNRVSQDSSSPYHHISTFLSSPAPSKAGLPDPCWGEVCSVFSSLHSRNVTVMVTSRARWPWGPLPSNARQWNENWVLMTCMRHISVAPWVLTGGGVRLSLPRAVWWQGKEWRGGGEQEQSKSCKAGRRSGESWSECFKKQNLKEQTELLQSEVGFGVGWAAKS